MLNVAFAALPCLRRGCIAREAQCSLQSVSPAHSLPPPHFPVLGRVCLIISLCYVFALSSGLSQRFLHLSSFAFLDSLRPSSISPLRHYRRLTQARHCYNSNSNSNIPDTDYWYIHPSPFSLKLSSHLALVPRRVRARLHTVPLLVWICSMSLSRMHTFYMPVCLHCIFHLSKAIVSLTVEGVCASDSDAGTASPT
ncbi:hypothetical protein FKP32DRAFT_1273137 [Trametes sanguinea]|nr:hypothetical protein FKP32DRAFT_1273137 [Trametes sanguinea]